MIKKRKKIPKTEYDLDRLTVVEAGRIFGVAPQTIRNWVEQQCPHEVDARGKPFVSSAKAFAWRLAHERQGEGKRPEGDGDEGCTDNLDRLRKHKADMAKIELDQVRGELVRVDDVRRAMHKAADLFRGRMETAGKKLAVQLARESSPEAVERMILDEHQAILREVSDIRLTDDDLQAAE